MNKFNLKAKLTSCQDIIDNLNEHIEEFNQLITEFKEFVDKLEFDGAVVDFEYVTKSKVQVDGFNFLIRDRLAIFKDPIMKNAMDAKDEEVESLVDALKKELDLDVDKFKMLFRLHDLSGKVQ